MGSAHQLLLRRRGTLKRAKGIAGSELTGAVRSVRTQPTAAMISHRGKHGRMNALKIGPWEWLVLAIIVLLSVIARFMPARLNAYDQLLEGPDGKYMAMRRLVRETSLNFVTAVLIPISFYFTLWSSSRNKEFLFVELVVVLCASVLVRTWQNYHKITRY